jgi:phosphoribosylglycinamide formyltransferase-1
MIKIVIITSTKGAILNKLLELEYFRNSIISVISDRFCESVKIAREHNIHAEILETSDSAEFSDLLYSKYKDNLPDLFVLFFTKILVGKFIEISRNRIVNLHPSILPSFKGLNGFEDSLKFGARFIGATIHFINEAVDEGNPIIQSSIPLSPKMSRDECRHLIFIHQCKMLLQVIRWVNEGRITFDSLGKVIVLDANYEQAIFSPNLDFDLAISF